MRLSDAMLLGSTMGIELSNDGWECCLLGISCRAVGEPYNVFNAAAERRWPWLKGEVKCGIYKARGSYLITHLCDEVLSGESTIEQVVDWVRSVEPPEPDQEQVPGVSGRAPLETNQESRSVDEKIPR